MGMHSKYENSSSCYRWLSTRNEEMSLLYSNESPYSMTLCVNDSKSDCTLCTWHNLSSSSIFGTILVSEDPRIETLRRYSYGIALPSICFLGIIGNIFNLIVLTRRNMRGTAYIYMRGKYSKILNLYFYLITWCIFEYENELVL